MKTIDSTTKIDAQGWLSGIEQLRSPNQDARPADIRICLIVIHAISLPPGEYGGAAVAEFFLNRLDRRAHPYYAAIADSRVSAHFFIDRQGITTQFVSCLKRAWHAGVSCWRQRERCNDFSLGIELEGDDDNDFCEAQYASLRRLLQVLKENFTIAEIVGHADIAPGRKTDPGRHFDWSRICNE